MPRRRFSPSPVGQPTPYILLSASMQSMGRVNVATQKATSGVSTVWPTANTALFFPFTLGEPKTYVGMAWMNGAAVSGNVNAAIYSADGVTSLAVVGSVAQAGTTAPQKRAFPSPVTFQAGDYFMALVLDNTTGAIVMQTTLAVALRPAGARQLAAFFALTASAAAWIGAANNRLPIFGAYELSWI